MRAVGCSKAGGAPANAVPATWEAPVARHALERFVPQPALAVRPSRSLLKLLLLRQAS